VNAFNKCSWNSLYDLDLGENSINEINLFRIKIYVAFEEKIENYKKFYFSRTQMGFSNAGHRLGDLAKMPFDIFMDYSVITRGGRSILIDWSGV
jgi:hypothetical protein